MTPCACGCGRDITGLPAPKQGGPRKYWHSVACAERVYRKTPKARARERLRDRRARTAERGRTCKWCGDSDHNQAWSRNSRECARCERQKYRRKCGRCGGPFWAQPKEQSVPVGCIRCNREKA